MVLDAALLTALSPSRAAEGTLASNPKPKYTSGPELTPKGPTEEGWMPDNCLPAPFRASGQLGYGRFRGEDEPSLEDVKRGCSPELVPTCAGLSQSTGYCCPLNWQPCQGWPAKTFRLRQV